jgi:glycosyltransferase involved in cell wall biosynthesis
VRIAFHTPLNAFEDARISGDRRMARQLAAAMTTLGHRVEPIFNARSYMRTPDGERLAWLLCEARTRRAALLDQWQRDGNAPELWFTYHSYYKAPDLLGPEIAARLGIPYVVAEASDSERRAEGEWAEHVALSRRSFAAAALHFCFTARDRQGIEPWCGEHTAFLALPPFIRSPPAPGTRTSHGPPRLITVAMMRPGKLASYQALASVLGRLAADEPWTLTIIGDGPMRSEVEAAFAGISPERLRWCGAIDHEAVTAELVAHDIFFWPGVREAYGLVYLEAQAAALPVVAFNSGGVSATVRRDETALLAPDGDMAALRDALARLLTDKALRARMSAAARSFIANERSPERAGEIIGEGLALAFACHAARNGNAR